jgi:hypothetical protein
MTLVIQPLSIPYNSLSAFVSVNAEPFRLINNLTLPSALSCNPYSITSILHPTGTLLYGLRDRFSTC